MDAWNDGDSEGEIEAMVEGEGNHGIVVMMVENEGNHGIVIIMTGERIVRF